MLSMGFADQLARIMEDIPKNRQTLLFSATILPAVEKLARRSMYEPERVSIGRASAASTVDQHLLWMTEETKRTELLRLLREEKGSIIIFTRTKDGASRVWRYLHSRGVYDATFIHSDRLQAHREAGTRGIQGREIPHPGRDRRRGPRNPCRGNRACRELRPSAGSRGLHPSRRPYRPRGGHRTATSFVTGRDRRLLAQIEKAARQGNPDPGWRRTAA